MTSQKFDFTADELLPRDSHVTAPAEIARLASQSLKILDRLYLGPMTRDEIAAIGRNPTARVSDLRKALRPIGKSVELVEFNRATGFSRYGLVDWPQNANENAADVGK